MKVLRELVRKDPKTNLPKDGDLSVCNNLLNETRKRAQLVIEHTKKAEKYMGDITEYLTTLEKCGVKCPLLASGDPAPAAAAPSVDPSTKTPGPAAPPAASGSGKKGPSK